MLNLASSDVTLRLVGYKVKDYTCNCARMILIFHDLDIVKVNKYSLGETYIEV